MEIPEQIVIASVNDADVLSGRGGKTNTHSGNRIYRCIVKENRRSYKLMTSNSHKQLMAESIIICVHNRGGRFLKHNGKDQNTWVELSKEEALVKTTQALREIPSGTSSRAFNVERMLEQKRKQKNFASSKPFISTSNSSSEDRKISVENQEPAATSRSGSDVVISKESVDDVLSDNELESIVNDSDAFETILSLLDK
jgi:hypothetical protein